MKEVMRKVKKRRNLTMKMAIQMASLKMRKVAGLEEELDQQVSRWPQLASRFTWAASATLKTFLALPTS